MNLDLEELYQQVILDHGKSPRNFGEVYDNSYSCFEGQFPSCAEKIKICINKDGDLIKDIAWTATGSMLLMASGSIVSSKLKTLNIMEGKRWIDKREAIQRRSKENSKRTGEKG